MNALAAAWQTLQENAERMAVKVLAGQASSILSQARAAAWLPELPPKGNAPVSPYIAEILQYLDVSSRRHFPIICKQCAYVQHLLHVLLHLGFVYMIRCAWQAYASWTQQSSRYLLQVWCETPAAAQTGTAGAV